LVTFLNIHCQGQDRLLTVASHSLIHFIRPRTNKNMWFITSYYLDYFEVFVSFPNKQCEFRYSEKEQISITRHCFQCKFLFNNALLVCYWSCHILKWISKALNITAYKV